MKKYEFEVIEAKANGCSCIACVPALLVLYVQLVWRV